MGSFYTESSYNFGTNSAQFPADRERHKGEDACGTRERPRAVQGRGRERYKGKDAGDTRERARSGTRERTRAIQWKGRGAVPGRGRERYKGEAAERYKENKGDGTAGDRKDDSVSPTVPSPIRLRTI